MSTNKIPTLEETIERMKTEIIAESRIPDEASDFGTLHDFIDANELGGLCEDAIFDALVEHFGGRDKDDGMPDGMMDYVNAAQDAVSAWLEGGGLKRARNPAVAMLEEIVAKLKSVDVDHVFGIPQTRIEAALAQQAKADSPSSPAVAALKEILRDCKEASEMEDAIELFDRFEKIATEAIAKSEGGL